MPKDETAISLDAFWDQAPCGFLLADQQGLVLRINSKLLSWLGYRAEDIVGKLRFCELLTPAGRLYHDTVLFPTLLMVGAVNEVALDLQCRTGETLSMFLSASYDSTATPASIWITLVDASERRRYERDLLTANRTLQAMIEERKKILGMVTHDLRSPLGAIIGLVPLLEDSVVGDEAHEFLSFIQSTGHTMLALIDDLLDTATSEGAGQLRINPELSDLCDTIRQAVAVISTSATAKGSRIALAVPETALPCRHDPSRLIQALSNLLSNAIKFSPANSEISISLVAHSTEISIAVADRGPGIAAREVEKLFQPFATGSATSTSGERSTGLGLSIVHGIALAHGGRVEVSPGESGGSIFSFILPYTTS